MPAGTVHLSNKYDKSLVYDEKYHKNDFVFLSDDARQITGVKRDYQIAAAALLLFGLMAVFGRKQGYLTIACLLVNVLIFAGMMKLYMKGWDILGLSAAAGVIFAGLVILFINGFSKKTLICFLATIVTAAAVCALAMALIWNTKNMGYDFLDFLPEPYSVAQANHFFLAQVLIGCIGAVIDVAVTITACSSEIIRKAPDINAKQLVSSVRGVADDITGTMINVVFFTNVASIIPVFIISMCNDIRFTTVIRYDAFFDIARFLTGAIAILIAIPVSVFASSLFFERG